MKCPTCKKPIEMEMEENPYFPFCSERCRLVDLGAWLDEKYFVPGTDLLPDSGNFQENNS